jgi:hypothetical protein
MKNCSHCQYGYADELKDIYCVNSDSEYCTEYVGESFHCENYTEKFNCDKLMQIV